MSTTTTTSNRDGFALPVALLAIIVIGAIVTGGFYASSQESRISISTDLGNQAFYVAEYGLEAAHGTWKNNVLDSITGTGVLDPVTVMAGGSPLGTYQISIRRIGEYLFLVTSEGRVQAGPRQAVRKVGSILRIKVARPPYQAALAVFGGLDISGTSSIEGDDSGGPGCVPGDSVPGAIATDPALVTQGGASDISGDPPIDGEPSMTPTTMSDFGAVGLQDLIDAATHVYAAGASVAGMAPVPTTDPDGNLICDTSVQSNWGDPTDTGPCGDYFPIIYAEGDFEVQVGVGQGIMIVEGDLYADGNYDFFGLVIVKGTLYTAGTGNHIEGSVLIMGDGDINSSSTTAGNALVQYSRCRVERAFNANLRPRPLAGRSWMDFTAITRGEADD